MVVRHLRFAAGLVALAATSLLTGLLLAATVIPLATDLERVVLTSGSMQPSLRVGDVIVTDPDVAHPVRPGTVLVFTDPNRPGMVTHRVSEVLPDGSYRTKGDANNTPDSAAVTPDTVHGRGRLLVPVVGLPAAWVQQGHPERAAAALGLAAVLVWLARFGLLRRYEPWQPSPAPDPGATRRHRRRHRRRTRGRWVAASAVLAAVALAASGLAASPLTRAAYTASTANSGNYLATAAATTVTSYYLKTNAAGDTASSVSLPLTRSTPTLTTLYNYDTDRDREPGLFFAKARSGTGLDETNDNTRIQRWNLPVTSSVTLSGTATVRLWSAIKRFEATKSGSMAVGLYDCDGAATTCTQIAVATVTSTGSWSGGSSTWVPKDWNLGPVNTTLAAGRTLQLRVAVPSSSTEDMWLAYDTTAYPSALTIR